MNWRADAECAKACAENRVVGEDLFGNEIVAHPDLWFLGRGEPSWPAKSICAICPVREPCLLDNLHEKLGIWGGASERDRRRIRRQRSELGLEVGRCEHCDRPFTVNPKGQTRRYCDLDCRVAAKNARRAARLERAS